MREVPSYISERLKKNIQTKANNAAPSAEIWVSRASTPITHDSYLERQTVVNGSVTDVSIAVCHPRIRRTNTHIFMAYVSEGVAKVVMSKHEMNMDRHAWHDTGFEEDATAVAIAFDGTMPKVHGSDIEFVTEQLPWVFWVNNGALLAQKLGGETITLAEANCSDVSAIRAAWTHTSTFDYGLVVFFILGGFLYYRQLIKGKWADAELVSFGPSEVQWSAVSAFRTWDFRIGVQLKSTTGDIYELFTQFMGIGTRNAEHLQLIDSKIEVNKLTTVYYSDIQSPPEHLEIVGVENTTIYNGLYSIGKPTILSVRNIDDGTGDWGKEVIFEFDKELSANSVAASTASFYFVDEDGKYYFASSASVDSTGKNVILRFVDINNAVGVCTACYDPGSVVTMVNVALKYEEHVFTPINLVPTDVKFPEVLEITNVDETGTQIRIRFTKPIVFVSEQVHTKFIVTIFEPEYSPGGSWLESTKSVIAVTRDLYDEYSVILHFEDRMYANIRNAIGEVAIQYYGTEILGAEGPVLGFRTTFLPTGLQIKPNPHTAEHLEITNAECQTSVMTKIVYTDMRSNGEHLELVDVTDVVSTITNVDDI